MEHKDVVRLLWTEMSKKHGFKWCRKDKNNWFANLSADVLNFLKIQSKTVYLENYVTTITIPTDCTIHTPFEPGIANDGWSLEAQENVLMHEVTHIIRAKKMGSLTFDIKYLSSPPIRAFEEMMARHADVEYMRFRFGGQANIEWLSTQLAYYACSSEVPFVQKSLESVLVRVEAGGVASQSVLEALEILRREAPELIAIDPLK